MRFLYAFLLFCLASSLSAQQPEGLRIRLTQEQPQDVSYPPGTEFFLMDSQGEVILADGDLKGEYTVPSDGILLVGPPYKDGYDRFTLRAGDLLSFPDSNHGEKDYGRIARAPAKSKKPGGYLSDTGAYSGPVKITRKEFFPARASGNQNVLLVFNNGVVFRYFDGEARAWENGDEIAVEGSYLVYASAATLKISYNPENGEIWYVAEPKGKS